MKLYAYCITRTASQPSSAATGMFDRETYAITAGELSAFVSDVAEEAVVINKQSVLTHQQVVGSLLDQTTPLPFRFGTVVSEAELMSYLESRRQALLEKLALVDGCVEMSIKIIWQKSALETPAKTDLAESGTGNSAGTEFLRKKSAELAGNRQLIEQANDIAAWLERCLGSAVRDMRMSVSPSRRLVLAADCLVPRVGRDSYQSAVAAARSERPDLHFLTSGPWAPYSFVNIDLEFKSHFGVS
jgi:Gas vesicle synthesis protein GvpL/GvpF